jgi:hypothetical protein
MGGGEREGVKGSNGKGLNKPKLSIFTARTHQETSLNTDFGIKNEREDRYRMREYLWEGGE